MSEIVAWNDLELIPALEFLCAVSSSFMISCYEQKSGKKVGEQVDWQRGIDKYKGKIIDELFGPAP